MPQRAKAKRETSAGGVVFCCTPEGPRFLLILDSYKNWGFPKGHIDEGESPDVTARREIQEETGLGDLILRAPLGIIDWFFRFRGRLIHKFCHFYLFESRESEATPQLSEGITACEWYSSKDALEKISYDNARGMLRQAIQQVPQLCPEEAEPTEA